MSPAPTAAAAPARSDQYLERAYALSGTAAAQRLYDEWAGAYDADNTGKGYASPRRCVEAVIRHLPPSSPPSSPPTTSTKQLRILDAGCGTGLVGASLSRSALAGRFALDGVDLSAGMLAVAAAKGVYRDLRTADLNAGIEGGDGSYDVVMCVGTLTKAHVGPGVLVEFARLTAKGGLVAATVHDEVWESGGYRAEVERLRDVGVVEVVSTEAFGILEEASTGGRMVVLRKN
ncbi:S-adenosyl-L-methionine-dependent methyltransferase [Hypoxylon argillaceum]|nr:S-adenosyl-L-methionine-dependent methyltransferase [Hypoxylon argillaceum]